MLRVISFISFFVSASAFASTDAEALRDLEIKAGIRLGVTRPYVRPEDAAKCRGECSAAVPVITPIIPIKATAGKPDEVILKQYVKDKK